jgi:16S rRNA G966 N2-methylase RsmD
MSITDKLSWRQPAVRERTRIGGDAVNQLFYGNNLDVLRASIKDESVDLIYLDPPFNSNAW